MQRGEYLSYKLIFNQDKNIELVFSYLDELICQKENQTERKLIGYKQSDSKN